MEDPNKITYFAATNSRGTSTPFGIKRKDRARHMYIIGKTGMGKSTLLENMAIQDIRNGEGIAFIDPHGSTADRIMEYVPANRIKDVVYFAPFDMDYPVAFNVMEDVGYDKRHLVVSGLLAAFRKIWVDAWSARMEYILSNTLLALLEYEGSTLLDVNRMLINKAFRKKVVENVTDPIVKSFWVDEFANYTDRYTQDATPAIQNKVGQFTSNPLIRNIVGQPKSSFDIRKLMDEKKILIMNLSKGRVGEVNATLLGSMLVTKIYLAAMSRADVPMPTLQQLPNFYFYVDEFQNFANESFSDILSEARKYKLNLIIAHQYVEQMEEEVRDAVFGNVGTTVAFRVGPFDAETLETVFEPQFTATDLVNLGFAQIYLTLMIDGVGSPPFSATTLPPFDPPPDTFVPQVLDMSRLQFGKPRAEVEEAIRRWHEVDPVPAAEPKPKRDYRPTGAGQASAERPFRSPSSSGVQPVGVHARDMQPTTPPR
ncbi:MAG TPA: type IV secretion system DNA-binding domain-containing protein, partial [Candidatus Paceibacterota bacterium]